MRLNVRWCPSCDRYFGASVYVCDACDGDTEPAPKLTANERAQGICDDGHEDWLLDERDER